ncbi:MAG: Asp-tRNA(Asn)/Glu-tRNA(Gln) amidotransferase subunit GatA [Chloroflexi bacterium]|uniref:Glutamyl-tRNA(Gln) amidotransferase subunit A n=1 Tax=Candidatus Chlorohelix allophototropha TaxID=3003348 RepID=A0A8T7M8H5_9CHLR|nr:Asp-tRNA(Asn)/Glu-tRNA(Gln) amidotransferase subunit GatA [Chloroflexota bacterium]WJW68275.1 Asp-tRNA(Asn)/Glu-tRNA(Gln) amidotransferase subunit GatA [Chloroflexota bacterium L227-S17]
MELHSLNITEAAALLRKKEITSRELTTAVIKRIEEVDGRVKAFMTLTPELALQQADAADKILQNGAKDANPLLGIPMSLKDVLSTKGIRTACGSKILENYVPIYDATVARKLYESGAVMLGKNNMDEFAMGSSTENSSYFPTRNPWNLDTVPGGSSGGSSASVAAGEGFFSVGSDTGGSIRQPAALCGVVGLKPTYGRVSRYGLIAFASSLDQLGPFTRSVADAALVMNVIAGHDPKDSTSINAPVPDYTKALVPNLNGMKLALPREYFIGGVEPGVEQAVLAAVEKMKELGATVEEVSMPHTKYAISTYYIIAPAEASANLARYDGIKYGYSDPAAVEMWDGYFKTRGHGFGPEVKRRIMIGTYALSSGYYDAYYLKAQKVRTLIRGDFDKVFEKFDAIIAPTSPSVAFKIGDKVSDPLAMYLNDIFTIPANMAGTPGMSIPCGFSNGLPVGLQILGPVLGEEKVFRVAHAYEQATEWYKQHPAL